MKFTKAKLAEVLGVSVRRVAQLTADGIITQEEDGSYQHTAIQELINSYKLRATWAEGQLRRFRII